MPSRKPPHPVDETADELRAALARNHPEMSPAELDALLTGEPKKRRTGYRPDSQWTAGQRGAKAGGSVVRGRSRYGSKARRRG